MLRLVRARSTEIPTHGGVSIPAHEVERMMWLAGYGERGIGKNRERLIDTFTADGDDAHAFLERVERDRYHLGTSHTAARDFLKLGAEREAKGVARGRASANARARGKRRRKT